MTAAARAGAEDDVRARVPDAPAPPGPAVALDPVCGMEVLVEDGALQAGDVYFCGPGCLARFTGA